MATRGAVMSPSTEPFSLMLTLSLAVTLPFTSPSTTTDFANTCALILPLGPIVSTCWRSSILPSTRPSTVRSSLPFSSPLMTTDFPMLTRSVTRIPSSSLRFAGVRRVMMSSSSESVSARERSDSSRFHISGLQMRPAGYAGSAAPDTPR